MSILPKIYQAFEKIFGKKIYKAYKLNCRILQKNIFQLFFTWKIEDQQYLLLLYRLLCEVVYHQLCQLDGIHVTY